MAALAGFLQVVVLSVTAYFVWKYLKATQELGKSSRDQVLESHKLVEAAQEQLAVSQEQIRIALEESEAQMRPAIGVSVDPHHQRLLAENVGSGPAFDLKLVSVPAESPIQWDQPSNVNTILSGAVLGIGPQDSAKVCLPLVGGTTQELQVMYKSLSGREYVSVVRFESHQRPIRTTVLARQ
jgi:hypothetical protein